MDKIKDALWNDYEEKKELLNDMRPGSDEYKVVASEVDNIRKELIDVDKTVAENEFKVTQAADDSKKEKTRNRISIGTFITSTAYRCMLLERHSNLIHHRRSHQHWVGIF